MSIAPRTTRTLKAAAITGALFVPALTIAGTGSSGSGKSYVGGGGAVSGLEGISQREIARRLTLMEDAMESVARGDALAAEGDYEGAITEYRQAIDWLPDAPMSRDRREIALARFADASVNLAKQRAQSGQYEEARKLLENVLEIDPEHAGAQRLLSELDDPQRYSPALTPQHVSNVQDVERLLQLAVGQYDLAQFDQASETLQSVLRIDRYNSAARRMMEKVEGERVAYYHDARGHMRAKMLADVDATWEDQIPPSELGQRIVQGDLAGDPSGKDYITTKLQQIRIPSVQFADATVAEAVDFLRMKSKELDTIEQNPEDKGVNIILKDGGAGVEAPRISLDLTNVPLAEALRYITDLAGLKYKVEAFAVVVVPLTDVGNELYTRVFRVPPDFLEQAGGDGGGEAVTDPFATDAPVSGGLSARKNAKDILAERGITFPDGASAYFSPTTSQLIVRNSQANLDLIDAYAQDLLNRVQRQIHIMTKFVEVSQSNTEELGFQWLLGAFNIGGERVFGNGGTPGNSSGGSPTGIDFPITYPSGGPVGGAPLTSGLRSGNQAISVDNIDGLIRTQEVVSGAAPGIFSMAGVFTDPQFQVVVNGLSQKKGIDLMSAPSVVTRSGQRASIEIIREFIYPTEFDPPEIPQEFASVSSIGGGQTIDPATGQAVGGAGGANSFPVTPTTPTAFETRSVGVTLEVDPVIGNDGYTIDLNLAPEVVEFDGFINYGSPIQASATNPDGSPTTIVLTENRIDQPVFSTRKVTTAVTIWDGQTVAIGGLIREDVQDVEDKVPILGDLPLIGRLFQSQSEHKFKRNLMMFVTARLIDPAGQPIRGHDEIHGASGSSAETLAP